MSASSVHLPLVITTAPFHNVGMILVPIACLALLLLPSKTDHDRPQPPARWYFWNATVGNILGGFLRFSHFPEDLHSRCMAAFSTCMVPLMGPTPSQFIKNKKEPMSTMVDDHTPMELSFVISPSGKSTIKFSIEPLHPESGLPAPPMSWLPALQKLGQAIRSEHNDLHWSEVCMRHTTFNWTTTQDDDAYVSATASLSLGPTQFAFGGEIRLDGVAQTRAYFCPGPRAKLMGVSPIVLLTSCLDELGLSQPWERVTKFIGSCPLSHHVSDPFFLAVGTAPANNNSAKVYFRTQASSLTDLLEYMMMTMHGGPRLTSTPDALQAIASFRRLWSLLFPGVKDDQPLYSLRPDQPSSGFLVYYEMKLGSVTPQAKVYINVKHFCPDDAHVARAIATYYDELGHSTFAQAYLIALQSLYHHRPLNLRSGIHNYIGVGVKNGTPRVTLYHSPEAFAPERCQ